MSTKQKPVLIFVRGLPGSGKSFFAAALGAELNGVLLLDPDATDYGSQEYIDATAKMAKDGVDEKLHPYRFLRAQAYRAIDRGQVTIWNQAFTNLETFRKMTARLEQYASNQNAELSCLVVEVDIDQETARRRVAERAKSGGHDVSEEEFARFIKDYQTFEDTEYVVVRVSGDDAVEESVKKVIAKLSSL